ncbi:MAG: aspartate aminotransferase family protein [Bdellovibrionales bacterium]|nr:aspartate aminotransferase family protein [Bdellovibrionales bacterium]
MLSLVTSLFERWFDWRRRIHPGDGCAISIADQSQEEFDVRRSAFSDALSELMTRFEHEVPKFSPRYVGHMFSETALPALFGHLVALIHNPNNISGESSRVGVHIEHEAVGFLAQMVGYRPGVAAGHFTSGGTIANFESLARARARCALWLSAAAGAGARSGSLFESAHLGWQSFDALTSASGKAPEERFNFTSGNPWERTRAISEAFGQEFRGPVVLVPGNKHYSWPKGVELLGLGTEAFWPVELDGRGKLDPSDLAKQMERARREGRPILMVVSVAGTTEFGGFDPVHEVTQLLETWRRERGLEIWHHVDAAYGGFFRAMDPGARELMGNPAAAALEALSLSDSITLDPHKLGYVPYASGAFLTRIQRDYLVTRTDAPYVAFDPLHDRGPFTLEGSRSAAGAAATWMIARSMALSGDGYGRILRRSVETRKSLEELLLASGLPLRVAPGGESNILCFTLAHPHEALSKSNARMRQLYEAFSPKSDGPFTFSRTTLRRPTYSKLMDEWIPSWNAVLDEDEIVLARLCLMNPFFGSSETRVSYPQELVKCLQEFLGRVS